MLVAWRTLQRSDFGLLSVWLAAPHVARWWRHGHDAASVEVDFGPAVDGTDPTEIFVIEAEGTGIGIIQRYWLDADPGWEKAVAVGSAPRPAVGIDYLIGVEARTGQGLGPPVIDGFVDETWTRHADAAAVVVAVQQGNRRSWRALEKAGFHRQWSGRLESDDPSDAGPSHLYVRLRPTPAE